MPDGRQDLFILPGLLEDADAFEEVIGGLAGVAAATVADLTRAGTIADLARSAFEQAPEGRFCLAGHSMGGYVALEMLREAPERIAKVAFLNTHARPDTPEATENRRRLMALATGNEAFKRQHHAIIGRIDSRPHLGRIGVPALVVAARDDAVMPVELLEELAGGIPGARLAVIEDCGHMASIERPAQTLQLLREWLEA